MGVQDQSPLIDSLYPPSGSLPAPTGHTALYGHMAYPGFEFQKSIVSSYLWPYHPLSLLNSRGLYLMTAFLYIVSWV